MKVVTARKNVDGIEISYFLRRGSERSILFLHGLGCSKESFEAAFEPGTFPDDVTLIVPDLAGHGESSRPHEFAYSLESHAAVITRLLVEEDVRRPYVVGHSMGGAIGLLCAEKRNDVAGFFCLEGNLIAQDCTVARRVAGVPEGVFVDRMFPLAPMRFRCRGLPTDPPASAIAFYRSAVSLVGWSESGLLLQKLLRLEGRKTYIHGDKSSLEVLNRLRGVDVVSIRHVGHFMMLESPAETYASIVARL
jgi:pimeloyl-ACP methyl ester carboxylesterase